MKRITWTEKYVLALSESITVKQIQQLRDIGQPRALEIRRAVLDKCALENIPTLHNRIPTELVLEETGYSIEYYYKKMLKEQELIKIKTGNFNFKEEAFNVNP